MRATSGRDESSQEFVGVCSVAAQGEVAQHADGPLAELGGAGGINPEADGDDGVEIVEGGEVTFAVGGSGSEFPNNCRLGQFSAGEEVFQVLVDGGHRYVEQGGEEFLGEPDGLLFDADLDTRFPGLGGEDQKLGGAVAQVGFFGRAHGAGVAAESPERGAISARVSSSSRRSSSRSGR
jgi:hypothetical protein